MKNVCKASLSLGVIAAVVVMVTGILLIRPNFSHASFNICDTLFSNKEIVVSQKGTNLKWKVSRYNPNNNKYNPFKFSGMVISVDSQWNEVGRFDIDSLNMDTK